MPELDVVRNEYKAFRVKKEYTYALMRLQNVVGVCTAEKTVRGKRTGEPSVVVWVRRKQPLWRLSSSDTIPSKIGGVPTDVIVADPKPCWTMSYFSHANRKYHRPYATGCGIGREEGGGYGTMGLLYYLSPELYFLTAGHVAMLDAEDDPVGFRLTQPDGSSNAIATVAACHHPLRDKEVVDAACCRVTDRGDNPPYRDPGWSYPLRLSLRNMDTIQQQFDPAPCCGFPMHSTQLDGGVQNGDSLLPRIAGLGKAEPGDRVWKSGATTGVTSGRVFSTDLTVWTQYWGKPVIMEHQIAIVSDKRFAAGGDSGAMIINEANQGIGMVIQACSSHTVATPIQPILRSLHGDERLEKIDLGD